MQLQEIFSDAARLWPTLAQAEQASQVQLARLQEIVGPSLSKHPETAVIAFGSLARKEWTAGSDVDWAVLHDGPASGSVRSLPNEITRALLAAGIPPPSEVSEFGKLSSSLEIVCNIASRRDARLSLSRRMLLIFESAALANDAVRTRLVAEVLDAYQAEETLSNRSMFFVPRYLLNDVCQFWRLMCTDYSGMTRTLEGKHWGLRSVKLNFSRKLLFISAVLKCAECHFDCERLRGTLLGPRSGLDLIYESLRQRLSWSPVETVGRLLQQEQSRAIISEYERFLATLDSSTKRDALAQLPYEEADEHDLLRELWEGSRVFHDTIVSAMLDNERLGPLTRGCLLI